MQIYSCVGVKVGDICHSSQQEVFAIFSHAIKIEVVYKGGRNSQVFFDILMRCLISLIDMVSNYSFCYAYLSYGVPSSFLVLVSNVIRETPTPFFKVVDIGGAQIFSWIFLLLRQGDLFFGGGFPVESLLWIFLWVIFLLSYLCFLDFSIIFCFQIFD